jgi:1-acyl-sn-glycerol-3-phosphate acyltransferase
MSERQVDPVPFRMALARVDARPSRLTRPIRIVLRAGTRLCRFRIAVEGLEHLPRGADGRIVGGWILAGAPHRAWVDPLLLILAWPADAPRLAWLGDGPTVVRSWWRRLLLPRLGVIPIVPGGGPAAVAEHVLAAASILDRGAVLALFVERGDPSPPDRTREIAGGFAWMALGADAAVVPAVIGGAHRIVRGSSFVVRFLAPLAVPAEPGRAATSGPARPRSAELVDRARRPAAEALVDAYREAVSGPVRETAAWTDIRSPAEARWRWLATLFH